jgi:hypothetical protein
MLLALNLGQQYSKKRRKEFESKRNGRSAKASSKWQAGCLLKSGGGARGSR